MRLLALLLAACFLAAADGPRTTVPAERTPERHQQFLAVAKAGGVDLLFLGDSITDGWRNVGKTVWEQYFAPLKAANFGIGGDRTEHVIWRLRNGELEGIHPKLAVVMIGTNNGGDPAEDVALGIKTIIGDIQSRSPGTRILLLGIFPRDAMPAGNGRLKNDKVNQIIAGFASPSDPRRVVYLDIGDKFLTPDKMLGKDIMPDALHPNAKGYQIWAEAIIDPVKRLLADDPGQLAPTFSKRSDVPKVAKIEEAIMGGGLTAGAKALEKLSSDKDAATAEAAKTSLEQLAAWKTSVEAGIAKQRADGDVYGACEMVAAMAKLYTGEAAKPYKEQEAELRKDPGYAAGKEFQKLADAPMEARRGPRFAKQVEAFLKKHPDGFYADEARKLTAP